MFILIYLTSHELRVVVEYKLYECVAGMAFIEGLICIWNFKLQGFALFYNLI